MLQLNISTQNPILSPKPLKLQNRTMSTATSFCHNCFCCCCCCRPTPPNPARNHGHKRCTILHRCRPQTLDSTKSCCSEDCRRPRCSVYWILILCKFSPDCVTKCPFLPGGVGGRRPLRVASRIASFAQRLSSQQPTNTGRKRCKTCKTQLVRWS